MITLQAFLIALRQMGKNPLRAALTTLSVMIGVAAVIAMVILGRGATADIQGQLAGLGQNLLFVSPGQPAMGGQSRGIAHPFADSDATFIARSVQGLRAVAAVAGSPVRVVRAGASWSTMAVGVTEDYLTAMKWQIQSGRSFTEDDERSGAAVVLLGETTRQELFGAEGALGKELRMNGAVVTIVGILKAKGRAATGMDPDDTLMVPLSFMHRRIVGNDHVSSIIVSARDGEDTARIQEDIIAVMRGRRHLGPDQDADFFVRDMKEIEQMVGAITGVLSSFLAAVAAISLLVGGIGIMNIMLVAVSERTREIGLRLALGARARDVMLQFLVEAMVLSADRKNRAPFAAGCPGPRAPPSPETPPRTGLERGNAVRGAIVGMASPSTAGSSTRSGLFSGVLEQLHGYGRGLGLRFGQRLGGQAQMLEDAAHDRGFFQERDDLHRPVAA